MNTILAALMLTTIIGQVNAMDKDGLDVTDQMNKKTRMSSHASTSSEEDEQLIQEIKENYTEREERAYEFQNKADEYLGKDNFHQASLLYLVSLKTVWNNHDLKCFLKRVGFNPNLIPDIEIMDSDFNSQVKSLSEKLRIYYKK